MNRYVQEPKKVIRTVLFIIIFSLIIFSFIFYIKNKDLYNSGVDTEFIKNRYSMQVKNELDKYGLGEYLSTVLAIIEVESGGDESIVDVMQSSESINGELGHIDSIDDSIAQGIKHLNNMINKAEKYNLGENAAIQAYNFGSGYLDYLVKYDKKHSYENSKEFSKIMSNNVKVEYNNSLAKSIDEGYRYKYGNQYYYILIDRAKKNYENINDKLD